MPVSERFAVRWKRNQVVWVVLWPNAPLQAEVAEGRYVGVGPRGGRDALVIDGVVEVAGRARRWWARPQHVFATREGAEAAVRFLLRTQMELLRAKLEGVVEVPRIEDGRMVCA